MVVYLKTKKEGENMVVYLIKGVVKGQGTPYYEVTEITEIELEEINWEELEKMEYVNKSFEEDEYGNTHWKGEFTSLEILTKEEYRQLEKIYSSIDNYFREKYEGWGV